MSLQISRLSSLIGISSSKQLESLMTSDPEMEKEIRKIIAGVLEASEGTCRVTGAIAPLIELGAGFDMDLTAKENIYLNGALLGYQREFIDDHFDDIVSFADDRSEMFFGLNGNPDVSDFSLEQAARQTNTPKTLKDLCQHVVDLVSYVRKNASDDSKGFYLQSLIDDFTGKMYKNIFLSTFDKSVRDEMQPTDIQNLP